jgi:hypothetical protein
MCQEAKHYIKYQVTVLHNSKSFFFFVRERENKVVSKYLEVRLKKWVVHDTDQ